MNEPNGSWNDIDEKTILMEELKEAVQNIQIVRLGKLKARSAKSLFNELYAQHA